jgi:plastocyanin
MKKLLALLAGTLAIAGAAPATTQSDATATHNVAILATGFQPAQVIARVGDTVTWRNADTKPHRVVSETGAFSSSPLLDPGETYSFRFGVASSYAYRDGTDEDKTGIVHVRGARITLALNRLFVVYRNPVRVAGTVATPRAGQEVTINITRYGGEQLTRVVTTDADGVFELADRPPVRTAYEASWEGGESPQTPFVNVRPLVIFRVVSHRAGRFYVKVAAQRSYGGRTVFIQHQRRGGNGWVTVRRVRLNRNGEARFNARFPRGAWLGRAWVRQAPGYIPGFSVTKLVSR